MSDPLHDYREAARQYELAYDELARLKASQRAYWVMVGVGAVLSILLSATVVIGLWKDQPGFTRWAGLVLVLMLTLSGVTLVVKNRPSVTKYDLQVRNLAYDKQTQAARLPLEPVFDLG